MDYQRGRDLLGQADKLIDEADSALEGASGSVQVRLTRVHQAIEDAVQELQREESPKGYQRGDSRDEAIGKDDPERRGWRPR